MKISDFDYPLPDERVAKFPLGTRDASRLLVWRGGGECGGECGGGRISETVFSEIARELPPDCTLVFNDTRVVRARLAMWRPSGARIEILCLEPHEPADYERAFAARGECEWRAMIGNAKKWKSGPVEIRNEGGGGEGGGGEGGGGELLLRAWRCRNADGENEGGGGDLANRRGAATRPVEESAERRSLLLNFLAKEARSERLDRRAGQAGRDSRANKSPNEAGEIVRFEWEDGATFGQKLEQLGRVPIPPYLDRDTQEVDNNRYQTVYAAIEGSVAAPTAGLHFSPELIDEITRPHTGQRGNLPSEQPSGKAREDFASERTSACVSEQNRSSNAASGLLSRQIERVTLHVGAGTFLPVKTDDALDHPMHTEHFEVSLGTVERLAGRLRAGGRIVAVGTTSVRTLESLAILSYQLTVMSDEPAAPIVGQFAWREVPEDFSGAEALEKLARWMRERGLETLRGETRIMIVPAGYKFRVVGGLVTNFHQPKSTLLLLVSAFLGDPPPPHTHEPRTHHELAADSLRPCRWRAIYDYALAHDFRFLSYGDSSLLLP